ncbi:MAG TPA: HAD hydrolase-like protein [Gemmatimonadaceae bacterium]|jgi:HAD superfamily hydrolase (TIGR01509 family)
MVEVVLVELEGVVFETHELRLESLRDALVAQSVSAAFDPDVVLGLPTRAAVVAALNGADVGKDDVAIDLIVLAAEQAFASRLATGGVNVVRGARTFLERAASAARVGAVTRLNRADATTLLRLSGLDSAFGAVVCGDDVLDPKPSSEGYQLAIERLSRPQRVARRAILALEDSAPGIAAARAARIRCIAVGGVAAHVAMEADAYVSSLEGQTLAALDQLSRPGQERVQ